MISFAAARSGCEGALMDTRSEDRSAFDGSPALAAESVASDAQDTTQKYLLFAAAFAFFWLTASIISDSGMRELFGADSPQYEQLANGEVLDRITRFHPVTVAISLIWVKTIGAIFPKMWPSDILTALFALIGAIGVWAASSAFSLLVPKRLVPICGTIYACSLGVWYFSSIPEVQDRQWNAGCDLYRALFAAETPLDSSGGCVADTRPFHRVPE